MTSFSFNADSGKGFPKQILSFNTQWNTKRHCRRRESLTAGHSWHRSLKRGAAHFSDTKRPFLLKPLLPILYASNHTQEKNLVNKNKGRPGEHQE
jgi:hypothetical protein